MVVPMIFSLFEFSVRHHTFEIWHEYILWRFLGWLLDDWSVAIPSWQTIQWQADNKRCAHEIYTLTANGNVKQQNEKSCKTKKNCHTTINNKKRYPIRLSTVMVDNTRSSLESPTTYHMGDSNTVLSLVQLCTSLKNQNIQHINFGTTNFGDSNCVGFCHWASIATTTKTTNDDWLWRCIVVCDIRK